MRLSAFIAVFATATALSAAGTQPASAQAQNNQTEESKKVEVKPNDSLSKIADEHETTYIRLFDANTGIEHPDLIYPGDKIRIPKADEQLQNRPLPEVAPAVKPAVPQASAQSKSTQSRITAPKKQTLASREMVASAPVATGGVWDRLAQCEAGGNWSINTGNGYYGGLQFSLSSWRAVGGSGYPHQASRDEQISRGIALQAKQGWGAWPACSSKLGLR